MGDDCCCWLGAQSDGASMNYPPRILKDYVDWRVATDDVGLDVFASCGEGDFADAAERALLIAINELEGMASELRGSREPRLSALICKFVRLMGVPCVAEGLTNGHVDITITHPRRPELVMLGECKIWDGYDRGQTAAFLPAGRRTCTGPIDRRSCRSGVPVQARLGGGTPGRAAYYGLS